MYLLKAKAEQEEEERKEAIERRRKAYEEQKRQRGRPGATRQQGGAAKPSSRQPSVVHRAEKDERSKGYSKKVKYVTSFRVETGSGRAQAGIVRENLGKLSEPKKMKTVIAVVQDEGVKILSEDEKTVYMAHALCRISYTTVFVERHYFAFVAKNPGGTDAPSYCHVVKADKKEIAQNLNAKIGDHFKAAYAEMTLRKQKKSGKKRETPQMPATPVVPRHAHSAEPPPQEPKQQKQQHLLPRPHLSVPQQAQYQAQPTTAAAVPPSYHDSNESTLLTASWYQAGLPREIAMQILEQESEGAFLVRDSQSQPGNHVLSLKCPPDARNPTGHIGNFLIEATPAGLNLRGLAGKFFPDLTSLINHYSLNADGLPCRLHLHSSNPVFAANEEGLEDELKPNDPDYGKFFDKMMVDLDAMAM